jgi:hypothetical protein
VRFVTLTGPGNIQEPEGSGAELSFSAPKPGRIAGDFGADSVVLTTGFGAERTNTLTTVFA